MPSSASTLFVEGRKKEMTQAELLCVCVCVCVLLCDDDDGRRLRWTARVSQLHWLCFVILFYFIFFRVDFTACRACAKALPDHASTPAIYFYFVWQPTKVQPEYWQVLYNNTTRGAATLSSQSTGALHHRQHHHLLPTRTKITLPKIKLFNCFHLFFFLISFQIVTTFV